ncbi:MAG: CDP-diacylglycerol--glycerol-3-phosphate 3-phosphatidyltransferase [Desulfobacterales bacterium]|nr:CDP-diacylglycerol--glycerol-3-phosphate 3-phosphatidyltransferase [Desulfobacterales bacterium]
MNIPNILTLLRILLTPLFIILLLKKMFSISLIIFVMLGITDALDGLIARYYNQRTLLGAYLDPIADKLLLTSSFIFLSALRIMPSWLTVIVVSRDIVIISGIAILTISNIKFEIKPSIASKITTFTQLVSVIITLFYPQITDAYYLKQTFYWITAVLTIFSGLHYIYMGMTLQRQKN